MGHILILSGPSGSGKSTLCSFILNQIPNTYFSISTTTRKPRENEKDGVHYHFVSQETFLKGIENNEFLEWAEVHGNYYGTALSPITKALSDNKLVIFDVDVQGHTNIKHAYEDSKSIFITTRSKEVLRERLLNRQSDSNETIELRLLHAYNEMQYLEQFDYLIINDDLEKSKKAILDIVNSFAYIPSRNMFETLWQEWSHS